MKNNIKVIISVIFISLNQGLVMALSPALNAISLAYPEISVSKVQLLITAPNFFAIFMAFATGFLSKKYTKKFLMIFGLSLFAIAGTMPFFLNNFTSILVSRFILGIAQGIMLPLNGAIVADFFFGKERATVYGIQSAAVGGGMFLASSLCGILANINYHYSFLIYSIAIISALIVTLLLPKKEISVSESREKIIINKNVIYFSIMGAIEMMFLIVYSTNIAMHISTYYSSNATVSGIAVGIYSIAQVIIGIALGWISNKFGKFTLYLSMLCGGLGFVILVLFSNNLSMLFLGSLLCGFSQGAFIPQVTFEVSNCVKANSVAFATACYNAFQSYGTLISPYVINIITKKLLGGETTNNAFILSAIVLIVLPTIISLIQLGSNKK